MTKRQLVKALAFYQDTDTVMLAVDAEGNGHCRLYTVDEGFLTPDGDMYSADDPDRPRSAKRHIVLWPE